MSRNSITLPPGVHRVKSKGAERFYYQAHRGTPQAGPRTRLPNDPHLPEFWNELRKAQGLVVEPEIVTFNAVCDLYVTSQHFLGKEISDGTRRQYKAWLRHARTAWGEQPAIGLRPKHVRALLDRLGHKPGMANNVLAVLRALCKWGIARGHFDLSITHGVEPYKSLGGHKPWSQVQQDAALANFTSMLRRAYFLARYTGQRGSDVVRLGWSFIDDGGFRLTQRKTGREVWIPIADELKTEMASWPKITGPFLIQSHGKAYTHDTLDAQFVKARAKVPVLVGATLHGLRSTRVVELRMAGLTTSQISDQIGMSLMMIERYSRFADKKLAGKASVISLADRRAKA